MRSMRCGVGIWKCQGLNLCPTLVWKGLREEIVMVDETTTSTSDQDEPAPSPPLQITVQPSIAGPVLALSGELDMNSAALLAEHLSQFDTPPERLLLDLSQLTFCDSTGLSALIAAWRRLGEVKGSLSLTGAHGSTARLLRITGLDQLFPQYATLIDWQSAMTWPQQPRMIDPREDGPFPQGE